ncbi:hypothetical protein CERZMDRAFT_96126 [Cercospora zeae-maydis SCOH1-5]|uniref:Uncharacterized protein n=1 Tax=Cercospora zeae-maydis SCOH1-5 TaxID=717836 RepID=A0A6A6FKX2_9PEZI|nr:hypothetical protein CERZMDRAFT_96126 [Cercospora zeae-maydis SCOH1-5]
MPMGDPHKLDDLRSNSIWKCANYAEFVKRLQKMNPSATLDKQLADDAFRASSLMHIGSDLTWTRIELK